MSELWCWRRLLRVPWTARRSNQSILKEISPGCSLEGQMLKLKIQYFGYLMRRTDSFEKTLMLGKIEGRRRRGWQDEMIGWHYQLNGYEFEQAPRSWWWTGKPGMLLSMGSQRVGHDWATELNWTRFALILNRRYKDFPHAPCPHPLQPPPLPRTPTREICFIWWTYIDTSLSNKVYRVGHNWATELTWTDYQRS